MTFSENCDVTLKCIHDRERPPRSDTSKRRAGFSAMLIGIRGYEFVRIVHLYKMSKMESGSLTRKDGAIFSLTARDLENTK